MLQKVKYQPNVPTVVPLMRGLMPDGPVGLPLGLLAGEAKQLRLDAYKYFHSHPTRPSPTETKGGPFVAQAEMYY